jgi:phage terminase small subunit
MKLRPKHRLFVHEYLVDMNGARAAIRAGYSKRTAKEQAAQLLTKLNIKRAIRAAMRKREKRLEITADKWLRELAIIGFSDLKDYLDINEDTGAIRSKGFNEMPEGASRALESIKEDRMIREDAKGNDSIINEKVTFKLHDKLGALEKIGKHLGFLKDKIEHSGEIKTGPLIVKVVFVKNGDKGNGGNGDKK